MCAHCLLSYHWAPLRRVWLRLLYSPRRCLCTSGNTTGTPDSQTLVGHCGFVAACVFGSFPLRAVGNQCFAWGSSSPGRSLCALCLQREIHCGHRHPCLSRTWLLEPGYPKGEKQDCLQYCPNERVCKNCVFCSFLSGTGPNSCRICILWQVLYCLNFSICIVFKIGSFLLEGWKSSVTMLLHILRFATP